MKAHYHVGSNTPGYLSESDPYATTSQRAATRLVASDVRCYRDEQHQLPRSQRRTGHGSARTGYVYFERPGDSYDLGLAFWWSQCFDPDCYVVED